MAIRSDNGTTRKAASTAAAGWSALAVWLIALSGFGYYVVTFGSFAGNYGAAWAGALSLLWIALFVMLHMALPLRSPSVDETTVVLAAEPPSEPEESAAEPEPTPKRSAPLSGAVAGALEDDAAQDGVLSGLPPAPGSGPGGLLTAFERDVADWGYTYGVAWAGVRARYPEDTSEEVAERALAIAREVFAEYLGGAGWPERAGKEPERVS